MPDQDLLATCWTTAGDAAPLRGDERSRSRCGNGSRPRPRPGSVGSGCSTSTCSWPNGSTAWPGSGRCSTTTVSSTWSWSSSPTGGPTGHDGGGPTRSAGSSWRPPGRSAHATSRSRPTSAANPGTTTAGWRSSPCWPRTPARPGPGSGWSSFPGRTSGRSTTACGWWGGRPRRRRPHHRRVAHRAGRDAAGRARRGPAASHRRRGAQRRRRRPGGHLVRGHRQPSAPVRGGCLRPPGLHQGAPRRRLDRALGVEILSEAFRRLPVREAVAAAFATAEAQLELAGDGR